MSIVNEFELHYSLLNAAQKRAVDHADGPMLVLAGAGTGKTQIIALRIAKLLRDTDTAPHNILCLTFTESGVANMRERLLQLVGEAGYHVRVATFHSFCNEIIQEHPELFFIDAERRSLSDIERVQLLQAIIDDLPVNSPLKPFGAPYFYLNDLARALQNLKRENIALEQYQQLVDQASAAVGELDVDANKTTQRRWQQQQRLLERQRALGTVYTQYQTKLAEWKRYDYEDMLLLVVDQLRSNPDLLADYQERYYYILVDEYQDTNGAQNEVVRLLSSGVERPNLFVVGDDRQSIYRFQGASLENILYFQKLFGDAVQIISLQDNYRSQQSILDATEAMIQHNTRSLAKYIPELKTQLTAARDLPTAPLQIARLSTRAVEDYWVATRIKTLLAGGVPAADIAILYRNHRDAENLLELLLKLHVPVHVAAGRDVLSDPLVDQFMRLLRYVGLQGSDDELFHLMQFEWLQLPGDQVAQLTYQAHQEKKWLFEVCAEAKNKTIRHFAERMIRWRQAMHTQLVVDWFVQLVNESGWLQFAAAQPQAVEHLNRLQTLFAEIKELNRDQHDFSVQDLFQYLQLLQEHNIKIEEQALATQRQAVQCMTAHRAKGLEYSHVFIIQCVDRHWGNVIERSKLPLPAGILQFEVETDQTAEKNEDERRLFYVALTRAKQQVYLSYAEKTDGGRALNPSQFIAELPDSLVTAAEVQAAETDATERLQTLFLPKPPPVADTASRDWLTARLQNYRMSATHYNDYLECPRRFYYEHIVCVPRTTSRAVGFGIAIHNALRDVAVEFNRTNQLLSQTETIERFRMYLQQQLLSKRDLKDSLAFGEEVLTEYYTAQTDLLQANRFPEHDFGPAHVMVGPVPITGKIDALKIVDEEQKFVHVIDYKTGNPDNKSSQLAKQGPYHRQLLFYKLLVDGAFDFGYTAVSGEINFVQKSKQKNTLLNKQFEFSIEDAAGLKTDIQRVYDDIMNLKFLDATPEDCCGECAYCLWTNSN